MKEIYYAGLDVHKDSIQRVALGGQDRGRADETGIGVYFLRSRAYQRCASGLESGQISPVAVA